MVAKIYPCDVSDCCPFEGAGLSCGDACGLGRDEEAELPDEFDEEFYEVDDPELLDFEPDPLDYNNDNDFEQDNPWDWYL